MTNSTGTATKGLLCEELEYIISRVRKVQRGQEKGLDANLPAISAALKSLTEAKVQLDAALLPSSE